MGIGTKLFGTHSEREIKKIMPIVEKVMSLDEQYSKRIMNELKIIKVCFLFIIQISMILYK